MVRSRDNSLLDIKADSNTCNTIQATGTIQATWATPYLCMGPQHGQHHTYVCQRGQHHTSLCGNTVNTIVLYGAMRATPHLCSYGATWATPYLCMSTRTTPYFSMGQHGQHHTYVCQHGQHYGATRATPYFSMGQRGQHHTFLWGNTGNTILILVYVNAGNTILLYGAMRATPHLCMGQHH